MRKLLPLVGLGFLIGALLAWVIIGLNPQENNFNTGESVPTPIVENGADQELQPAPQVGSPAPDFQLMTYDGKQVRLGDLKGMPVLINFWATWCGPCRIEMPAIQSKFVEHEPDLHVLAVNFQESSADVEAFAEEFGLDFDLLLDPEGTVNERDYLVRAYPSSYFVDRDGVIQVVHLGIMSEGQLDDYLGRVGLE